MKGLPFRWIGAFKGVLLEKQMLECQRCLDWKDPTAFYLKSAKGEIPERREKICKVCKKGRRIYDHRVIDQTAQKRMHIPSNLEVLEEMTSIFLKLKQWRDEREAVMKVSNQVSFDINQVTSEKEIWRDYA